MCVLPASTTSVGLMELFPLTTLDHPGHPRVLAAVLHLHSDRRLPSRQHKIRLLCSDRCQAGCASGSPVV